MGSQPANNNAWSGRDKWAGIGQLPSPHVTMASHRPVSPVLICQSSSRQPQLSSPGGVGKVRRLTRHCIHGTGWLAVLGWAAPRHGSCLASFNTASLGSSRLNNAIAVCSSHTIHTQSGSPIRSSCLGQTGQVCLGLSVGGQVLGSACRLLKAEPAWGSQFSQPGWEAGWEWPGEGACHHHCPCLIACSLPSLVGWHNAQ